MAATAADAGTMVHISSLHKWYGQLHVLNDINLDVAPRRARGHLWAVRIRQIHPDSLHQPAGGAPAGTPGG